MQTKVLSLGGMENTRPESSCPKYESCNAQPCPLESEEVMQKITWFADEDVCERRWARKTPHWLKIQRKIKQRAPNAPGYFTAAMLNSIGKVHHQIEGINPDLELKEAERREKEYIKKRSRFVMTEEKRQELVERGRKLSANLRRQTG